MAFYNPKLTIQEAVIETDLIETVNDAEIAALADAARKLDKTGAHLSNRASDHTAAQMLFETRAETSAAGAENAVTEAGFHADMTTMTRSEIAADRHNTLGHSAEARAQDALAKSAALDQTARIEVAVREVTERIALAEHEIENRTAAGVEKEMRALAAAEDPDIAAFDDDLEAEARAAAAPRMSA